MNLFKNLSIKYKLIMIMMFVSIITLILTCVAFTTYDIFSLRKAMVRDMSTIADLIASDSTEKLIYTSRSRANKLQSSNMFSMSAFSLLRAKRQIEFASIHDKSGRLISKYIKNGVDGNLLPRENNFFGSKFQDNHLIIRKSIDMDNQNIGSLYILSSTQEINNKIQQYLFIVGFLIILLILLAFVLSSKLQELISKPVVELAKLAEKVSKGDFSQKAEIKSNDEMGALAETFNNMTADLKVSRDKLQSAKGLYGQHY